jgi:hypothetical protein
MGPEVPEDAVVNRAFMYTFFALGASGWAYTGVVAGGFAAVACFICGLVSAAGPWLIEEHTP